MQFLGANKTFERALIYKYYNIFEGILEYSCSRAKIKQGNRQREQATTFPIDNQSMQNGGVHSY